MLDICCAGSSGDFLFAAAWAKIFFRLERDVRASLPRWRSIFVLRASSMFCATDMTESCAVTVGFEIYSCLKNNMPDILVALVFCTHRCQQL